MHAFVLYAAPGATPPTTSEVVTPLGMASWFRCAAAAAADEGLRLATLSPRPPPALRLGSSANPIVPGDVTGAPEPDDLISLAARQRDDDEGDAALVTAWVPLFPHAPDAAAAARGRTAALPPMSRLLPGDTPPASIVGPHVRVRLRYARATGSLPSPAPVGGGGAFGTCVSLHLRVPALGIRVFPVAGT